MSLDPKAQMQRDLDECWTCAGDEKASNLVCAAARRGVDPDLIPREEAVPGLESEADRLGSRWYSSSPSPRIPSATRRRSRGSTARCTGSIPKLLWIVERSACTGAHLLNQHDRPKC
jgi:hypothetical protein